MTNRSEPPGSRRNSVSGGGVINSGNFTDSPVTNIIGDYNRATTRVGGPDPRIERLRAELVRTRRLLAELRDLEARSAEREAAIMVIDAVRETITDERAVKDTGKLRRRLDGLIAAVTPFVGIVEGLAAAVEVFKEIRSAF
jgi:hypothetical protein